MCSLSHLKLHAWPIAAHVRESLHGRAVTPFKDQPACYIMRQPLVYKIWQSTGKADATITLETLCNYAQKGEIQLLVHTSSSLNLNMSHLSLGRLYEVKR